MHLRIKLDSKGEVLYKQERVGLHGIPFMMYKFRTMYENAEQDGVPRLSCENDERITPFGRFMRKYRIDELPQFYNVLKGDMAIVGPRPERRYFVDQIIEQAPVLLPFVQCATRYYIVGHGKIWLCQHHRKND